MSATTRLSDLLKGPKKPKMATAGIDDASLSLAKRISYRWRSTSLVSILGHSSSALRTIHASEVDCGVETTTRATRPPAARDALWISRHAFPDFVTATPTLAE